MNIIGQRTTVRMVEEMMEKGSDGLYAGLVE